MVRDEGAAVVEGGEAFSDPFCLVLVHSAQLTGPVATFLRVGGGEVRERLIWAQAARRTAARPVQEGSGSGGVVSFRVSFSG